MPKHSQGLPERSHAIPSKSQRDDLEVSDRAQLPASGAILQRAALAPQSLRPADILRLQQTLGNRAVAQLLSQRSPVRSLVQAKLTVNPPGDLYEREADQMAAEVVDRINSRGAAAVQRESATENEDEEKFMMKPFDSPPRRRGRPGGRAWRCGAHRTSAPGWPATRRRGQSADGTGVLR